jgi:palmitoyltransferase ZDHHC4
VAIISFNNYIIMKAIKRALSPWPRRILGNFIIDKFLALFNYILYQKNPIVQILYLIIAIGGFAVYVIVGFMRFIPGPFVSEYHKTVGTWIMMFCYLSFIVAC